ncbi:porin family protein [Duncaniella freteri]|uniref:porin family protein n=1 Tax=Duncaniella freteri TaxID=2530391 RepID=UPI00256EA8DA|nr:porin family protein [Duncaniella freteri]
MKSVKSIILTLLLVMSASAAHAGGLFRFGPKVGLTVNELHFNSSTLDGSNKTGWTAGIMTEFKVPVIGIGADLSMMYVRRNSDFMAKNSSSNNTSDNRDYIEIPLNLRYNLSLPVINNVIMPYIAAGPSVSFLTSRRSVENAFRNKSVDWALNFGIGVQLVKHIDISARYGLGLTKAVKAISDYEDAGIQGKNRYWTISVAYLF